MEAIRKSYDDYPKYDTDGLFTEQANADNSLKDDIPLYDYRQLDKQNGANTRFGEPIVDTVEDQTRSNIGTTDPDDLNESTGGNFATARTLPNASMREFTMGSRNVRGSDIANNMSIYPGQSREHFGTDKPVEWSTAPNAGAYQNGSAAEQLKAPDFTIDHAQSRAAYDRNSMTNWKESMQPILKNYGNTLAKIVTFGGYKPKEGYCPGQDIYRQRRDRSSGLGQLAAIITVVIVILLIMLLFMKLFGNDRSSFVGQRAYTADINDVL